MGRDRLETRCSALLSLKSQAKCRVFCTNTIRIVIHRTKECPPLLLAAEELQVTACPSDYISVFFKEIVRLKLINEEGV
jgi:hypothetical protein